MEPVKTPNKTRQRSKQMSKKTIIAAAAVVVVAAGAFVAQSFLTPESAPEVVAPPAVRIEQPSTGDIELFRSMTGTIEPADSVYVIPKAAGEITAVYVKTGDYVRSEEHTSELQSQR